MPSGAQPQVLHLDDLEDIAMPECTSGPSGARWASPAFGINGYTADAGERVIEEHDETGAGAGGHEELYLVIAGAATFELDGREVDAPAGSLVFVPDPETRRGAIATAAWHDGRRDRRPAGAACRRRRSSTGSWPSRRTGRAATARPSDRAGRARGAPRATRHALPAGLLHGARRPPGQAMEHLRAALAGDPTLARYVERRHRSRRAPRPARLAGLRRGLQGVSLVPCRSRCRRVSSTS